MITIRHRDGHTTHGYGRVAGRVTRPPGTRTRGQRRVRLAAAVLAGSLVVANVDPIRSSAAAPGGVDQSPPVTSSAAVVRVTTGCNHLAFHTPRARRWTNRVHRLTDLTCRQARQVYRRARSWRDELPTRVQPAAGDRRIPNPARVGLDQPAGATASTVYCWVWTRESYRAPTFPFGHHTLWTVTVGQTFAYDGHNVVALSRPTVKPDTTRNGFRWFVDGAPLGLRRMAAVLGPAAAHLRTVAEDGNLVDPVDRPHPLHRPPANHCARRRCLGRRGRPRRALCRRPMTDAAPPAPVGAWFWCATHRQAHCSDQHGERGCTLAGPFTSKTEAETFGRRTDPEAFSD